MYGEQALPYLINAISGQNIFAMLLGVIVGLIVGAIPGLNPPMAIALMIPLSFNMPPETALILLVSCFAAGIYGGSFRQYSCEPLGRLPLRPRLSKAMK